jgi:hypothetical protein
MFWRVLRLVPCSQHPAEVVMSGGIGRKQLSRAAQLSRRFIEPVTPQQHNS